ncbi:decaprenyl-phosphate phosphoribosyltransferase [candidate division KSB1 bacterium]|nr:decaprenyl-phosphate phosphoribosyltransferase [candidate division KSB1 bacterium]
MLYQLLVSLRPKQWSKNIIVFAGLFFAKDIFKIIKIQAALIAFIAFCLISSCGYLINDILDRKKDRMHPKKKFRPIAAGKLPVWMALGCAALLFFISIFMSFQTSLQLGFIISVYFILTASYSLILKRVILLDVMTIAACFMFRAIGGAMAIDEKVSSWLILCTIFLALFLALSKRRAEAISLGDNAATVRKTLKGYTPQILDQMINTVTAACLMAYALYTLDPGTFDKFGTRNLVFTLPFVIYALFRYQYLVYNSNVGETPEIVLFTDIPILVNILLYGITVVAILYF